MADVLHRQVNITGFSRAITEGKDLKKAIRDINNALLGVEKGSQKYNELQNVLVRLKSTQSEVRNDTRQLTKQYIASGKAGVGAYRQLNAALARNRARLRDLLVVKSQDGVLTNTQVRDVKRLTAEIKVQDRTLKQVDATLGLHQRNVGNYGIVTRNTGQILRQVFGIGGIIAISAGLIRGAASEIGFFDRQLIAVGKTTNTSGKVLDNFGESARKMGADLRGISTRGLLTTSELAGQLGVRGTQNILEFSKTIEQLALTSNVIGQEASRDFAQFINLTNEAADNSDRLGSSITDLGNNFETTERNILSNANEIAQAGSAYNNTAQGVLALATATSALAIPAERARSAYQSTLRIFDTAIQTGNGLQEILQLLGLTQEELNDLFQQDTSKVFQLLVNRLNDVAESGGSVTQALLSIGIREKRASLVLGALANKADDLNDAFSRSFSAYDENIALQQEFDAATESLASRFSDVKDAFSNAITEIDSGKGVFSELTKSIFDASEGLLDFIRISNSQGIGTGFQALLNDLKAGFTGVGIGGITFSPGSGTDTREAATQLKEYTDGLKETITTLEDLQTLFADDTFEERLTAAFRVTGLNAENARQAVKDLKKELSDNALQSSGLFSGLGDTGGEGEDSTEDTKAPINNLAALRAEIKKYKEELEGVEIGSNRYNELLKLIASSEARLRVETDKLGKAQKQLADDGSLADLNQSLKEISATIDNSNLSDSELVQELEKVAALEDEIEKTESRVKRLKAISKALRDGLDISEKGEITGFGAPEIDGGIFEDPERAPSLDLDASKSLEEKKKELAIKSQEELEAERIRLIRERIELEQRLELARLDFIGQAASGVVDLIGEVLGRVEEQQLEKIEQDRQARIDVSNEEFARRLEEAEGNEVLQTQIKKQQEAAREKIDKEARAKKQKEQKKIFLLNKALAFGEALINTELAVTRTLASVPFPFNIPLAAKVKVAGLLSAGLIAAQGVAGALIAEEGAEISSDGKVTHGQFRGKSHKNGGIDTVINGVPVNVEGGEPYQTDEFGNVHVINKKSAGRHANVLNRIQGKTYPGKGQDLRTINSSRPLLQNGGVIGPKVTLLPSQRSSAEAIKYAIDAGVKKAIREVAPELAAVLGDSVGRNAKAGTMIGSQEGLATGLQNQQDQSIANAILIEEEQI